MSLMELHEAESRQVPPLAYGHKFENIWIRIGEVKFGRV